MNQFFLPPFYLCDKNKKLQYNIASNRIEPLIGFNSKPFRVLEINEKIKLNIKIKNYDKARSVKGC
jgi:hypothetical protein